ncbi:PepSY-associated TM helix domain-containing protein [uncultured Mucilaginibacter sp.]|uniref:PepSY-associated TM helix domain-containing protein n=1 Tax=uncultured Mucilaginibacter sp. TaxID=797541 RepID=UPI0025D0B808|nr:PepSY-associated TM helix domain-containing protein [uncultured Mucilaginibacter sp.]
MTNSTQGAKASSHFKKTEKHPKAVWKKRTASASRWLHIYLSMLSFIIILFFAVTGLTLNHADWFEGKEQIKKYTGKVPLKWVNAKDTTRIAKLEIVEKLKHDNNVRGDVSDFFIDDNQCTVSFKGPGYSADAFIDRHTAEYKLTDTRQGLVAVINDLHKGRDAGKKWGLMIDAASIFLTLLSITGIVMICFMKKKRFSGFVLVGVGTLIGYLVYHFLVP